MLDWIEGCKKDWKHQYKSKMMFNKPVPKTHLYYLASPYSSDNRQQTLNRYESVLFAASQLYNQNYNLLEPIASGHPTAERYNLPTGYEYWKQRDRLMVERSDGVIVAAIEGWQQSTGVADEVAYALSLGKPVWLYYPDTQIFLELTI